MAGGERGLDAVRGCNTGFVRRPAGRRAGVRPGDHKAVEALTRYMMRPPVSLARLKLLPGSDEVLHFPKGSGDDPGSAKPERFDAGARQICEMT